jgi:UDP-glucuronate decarboxylase
VGHNNLGKTTADGHNIEPVRGATGRERILVTGGAGFVGSHLCEALLNLGHEVICLDNFSSGRMINIAPLLENGRFKVLRHDVEQAFDVDVTTIFNFACIASPPAYQADPVSTLKTNIFGALHCLELANRRHATVIQASTSEVYGDPTISPQVESYFGNVNPIGPRACYDEGKRGAETLLFDFARMYGTKIKVGRIFNTYGPHMSPEDGRVVSNFIVQALTNTDITVYGSGAQTRSFCYVDDLIDGFLKLKASPASTVGPINLGNPSEFTVLELAEIVIRLIGSRSKIVHREAPADDPQRRRPDIGRAERELGWKPKIALEAGLSKTIAYFDNLLRQEQATRAI